MCREFEYDDIVLPDKSFSSCGNDSYATGVTVLSLTRYVYGVVLECGDVTEDVRTPGLSRQSNPRCVSHETRHPSAVKTTAALAVPV